MDGCKDWVALAVAYNAGISIIMEPVQKQNKFKKADLQASRFQLWMTLVITASLWTYWGVSNNSIVVWSSKWGMQVSR